MGRIREYVVKKKIENIVKNIAKDADSESSPYSAIDTKRLGDLSDVIGLAKKFNDRSDFWKVDVKGFESCYDRLQQNLDDSYFLPMWFPA